MELALSNEYISGAVKFKDARLAAATLNIARNLNTSKEAFVRAGIELMKIQDDKLYSKDFFDAKGKPSFAMYVETVLGISKSAAYRIMATTKKLLMPELSSRSRPEFFKYFSDSTLGVLSNNKLGDYDSVREFCEAYQITETTPRGDVEKYVKAYTRKDNPCMTLDDYINEQNTIDVTDDSNNGETDDSNNGETDDSNNGETDDSNNDSENEIDMPVYTSEDIEFAVQSAHILEYIPDVLEDAVSTGEMKILNEFIKRFKKEGTE